MNFLWDEAVVWDVCVGWKEMGRCYKRWFDAEWYVASEDVKGLLL